MRILLTLFILCLYSFPSDAQDETVDEKTYQQSILLMDKGWEHLTGKDFEVALDYFNQSIALYDGVTDAFVGRATTYLKLNQLKEAEEDIKKAMNLSVNQSDVFYLAGNVYFKMEYYEKASEAYSNAIEFNDESEMPVDLFNLYYNRGNAYFKSEFYRSAINDFTYAIREKADSYNAYHNRGLAYKHREELENACADFAKAKELGSKISDKFIEEYCR